MSEENSARAASCKLWHSANPDDADSEATHELGRIWTGEERAAFLLNGDVGYMLQKQPFGAKVSAAEWLLSERSLVERYHELYRLTGAAGALTYTAGASALALEKAGLAGTADAVISAACRAAFSAGPLYVVGLVTGLPETVGEAGMRKNFREEIRSLCLGRVHGLMFSDMPLYQLRYAVSEAISYIECPLSVGLVLSQEDLAEGRLFVGADALEDIVSEFSYKGVDNFCLCGATLSQLAAISQSLKVLSERYGVSFGARLEADQEGDTRKAPVFLYQLLAANFTMFYAGAGRAMADSATLYDALLLAADKARVELR